MKVEFRNIYKRYGNTTAVENLNLTLNDGALHFLLGPSGCGKTTTLRMLAGLEKVSEGKILFEDKDVTNMPAAERGIGMVFQNYALWPHMTVKQNIEYGLKLRKLTAKEIQDRIEEALDITRLSQYAERMPGQLSGGQQQRVALARALAVRPNVLLLDEPLSNLDAKLRLEMRENISRIHRQTGITTLYVTHDQKEALSMGSMVTVMHAGKHVQTGTPRELYNNPHTAFLAGFIGETNTIEGIISKINEKEAFVTTQIGEIHCKNIQAKGLKSSGKCSISIRPEALKINGAGAQSKENTFDLTLERLTYLGESEQLFLTALNTNIHLKANVFNPDNHDALIGKGIQVMVEASDCVLLPEIEDLGPGT